MPRFRSRMGLRPVQRTKHVVDSQFGLLAGTQADVNVIISTDNPVLANPSDVATGSTVHSIYLKVEASATSGTALHNLYLIVFKNPGNNLTVPEGNVIGINDNKKYVIHQEMLMLQNFESATDPNPRVVFQGVVRIPKGYKRNGQNDELTVSLFTPTGAGNASVCLQCIYQEYR